MKITDEEIKNALQNGGFVRRAGWKAKEAAYHLTDYSVLEFVYHKSGNDYTTLEDEMDAVAIMYDDLLEEDWEVKENG